MCTPTPVILELQNISKSFGKKRVFKDICTEVRRGEVVGVIGHSAVGKSTLLRCMALLEPIDQGTIAFCGEIVANGDGLSKLQAGRRFWQGSASARRRIGIVFQNLNYGRTRPPSTT